MLEIALCELVHEIGGKLSLGCMPPLAGDATPIGRIVIDSRQVEDGDVFWALKGPNHDGTDYVDEAFARGASGVVVQSRSIEPWAGRWSLQVEDSQLALWQLAAVARYRFSGKVVAVTGSVGKTTTRAMIHQVLRTQLQGTSSPGNFNNHIGLPLSMLQWNSMDDYAVVELGASSCGEIDSLATLCHPHVGVITCIGEAHLGGFGSQQAIAGAKCELLQALPDDGWAVLGGDDLWLRRLSHRCPGSVLFAGRTADCDILATDVCYRQGELEFTVEDCRFRLPVWGRHFLTAAVAAIGVGRIFELSLEEIAESLARFEPLAQRCQVVQRGGVTIIDDTYNASPTAARAALEVLRDLEGTGRRIVVMGDMAELGSSSEYWHMQLGEQTVTVCGADIVIACGAHAEDIVAGAYEAGLPHNGGYTFASTQAAQTFLTSLIRPGDAVLVKGSRIMQMETIVTEINTIRQAQAA
jgi:UDP-N-acetylmuramoyl-tripeptide--D-alanyl-D-alanine ligase